MTTAKTSSPVDMMRSEFAATTAATIMTIAVTETSGSILTAFCVVSLKHVDVDRLFKKQIGERRGDDRGEDGRNARHPDGERDVALAEVGHDVRRGASGAGADEDDADEQRVVELEELAEREGEERHDGELRDEADDYIARALKDDGEVRGLHRKPHTEHDYHKKRRNPARLYPDKRRRLEQRDGGDDDDDDRHVLSDELT